MAARRGRESVGGGGGEEGSGAEGADPRGKERLSTYVSRMGWRGAQLRHEIGSVVWPISLQSVLFLKR